MYPFNSPCHPGNEVCDLAFSAYVMNLEEEKAKEEENEKEDTYESDF
jgi:hypothetical protein